MAYKKIYSSRSCHPDKIKVVIDSDDEVFRPAVTFIALGAAEQRF